MQAKATAIAAAVRIQALVRMHLLHSSFMPRLRQWRAAAVRIQCVYHAALTLSLGLTLALILTLTPLTS